jgi:hypothetical protein
MLDKNQTVVAQTTVLNATHLAIALASKVFGNTLGEQVNGENLTRDTIAKVVIGDIRSKFNIQGVINAQ